MYVLQLSRTQKWKNWHLKQCWHIVVNASIVVFHPDNRPRLFCSIRGYEWWINTVRISRCPPIFPNEIERFFISVKKVHKNESWKKLPFVEPWIKIKKIFNLANVLFFKSILWCFEKRNLVRVDNRPFWTSQYFIHTDNGSPNNFVYLRVWAQHCCREYSNSYYR